jgi:hypothetical protein
MWATRLNLYSMVADDPESFADLDGHDGNGSTVGPGASWAGVSNAGGGRLTEGQVAGMGDDAPTVVDRIEPDSVLQARADQFMEWARATGNAGFGAQNQAKPAGLAAVNVQVMDTGDEYGIKLKVTYQILDQNGNAMTGNGAKMEPQEHVTAQINGQSVQGLPSGYADIGPSTVKGTSRYADAKGQFVDAPLGIAGTREQVGGPFKSLSNQEIRIKMGKESFAVRYNRILINSDSRGHGTFSNQYGWIGGDLNAAH